MPARGSKPCRSLVGERGGGGGDEGEVLLALRRGHDAGGFGNELARGGGALGVDGAAHVYETGKLDEIDLAGGAALLLVGFELGAHFADLVGEDLQVGAGFLVEALDHGVLFVGEFEAILHPGVLGVGEFVVGRCAPGVPGAVCGEAAAQAEEEDEDSNREYLLSILSATFFSFSIASVKLLAFMMKMQALR